VFRLYYMDLADLVAVDKETLRIIRRGKGFTQAQLAVAAGIGVRSYQSIESGETLNPGIQTMGRICDALGIKLMQILWETEPEDVMRND